VIEHRYPDSFRHSNSKLTDPIENQDDDEYEDDLFSQAFLIYKSSRIP